MNMCGALAAGVVVLGFSEWSYYVTDTPFQIEAARSGPMNTRRHTRCSTGAR